MADDAYLRNEPTVLIVGAEDMADKAKVESEIESLRTSGELDDIVRSMRLKGD